MFWSVRTSNLLVFALGLSCETPAACRPPGFHRTTRGRKQADVRSGPTKTRPKFHEKTSREMKKDTRRHPEREKKNENGGGRRKKKREILGGPAEGGPAEGGPAEGGPAEDGPKRGGGVRCQAISQIGQAKAGGQNWPKSD